MNNGLFRYRILLRVLAPAILLFNAWQAMRAGELRLFRQRLGVCLPRRHDNPLWLHAASVGELIAAQPLITALRERFPNIPIVVTTITPTGAKLAKQRLPTEVQHFYLPMDWPGATHRFLRAIKPRAALIMETELWPNLFISIARENIPLLIVNGRISQRTLGAAPWIKALYALCLKQVSAVLARSDGDADAYIQLGASEGNVKILGNIKFASTNHTTPTPIDLGRPFVLAASTHNDEEKQIAELWQTIETQNRLLVIAPRHPQRLNSIVDQLSHILNKQEIAIRTRGDDITPHTKIYLADTLGELEGFMAGADCVFMGGSLISHGGQNILEPARLGKPIVFGPHMTNFAEETLLLLQADAAKQAENTIELGNILNNWLAQPNVANSIGENAAQLLSKQHSVLEGYLQAINEFVTLTPNNAPPE